MKNKQINISLQISRAFSTLAFLISCFVSTVSFGQTDTVLFSIDVSKPGVQVAAICRGQQIEEFNHQIQGGLYAQLINNPSFEELNNSIQNWSLTKNSNSTARLISQSSKETRMLNSNQKHCLKLEVQSIESGKTGIANNGYWGLKIENSTLYKVSFWAKKDANFKGKLTAKLESESGYVYASSTDFKPTNQWKHFTCNLVAKGVKSVNGANRFVIEASSTGNIYFDVVTLMPPTWKNRPNGLRPDLAERLADLKFKFIQFPGGCTAESYKMDTSWTWKNSIGPIEKRAGSTRNKWGYKNDLYFGLDEYFQLCEDMDAAPIYTTSSGISERPFDKDFFGIAPFDKMQPIINDIMDLLEYCNGATSTFWGAKRAANGHPGSYNLNYIEIGNENSFMPAEYNQRYPMIYNAIKAKYPDIKVMYNGILSKNEYSTTSGNQVDYTDEHFYWDDLSSLYNKYDSINAECKKICVAEYASSVKGNDGNISGNFADAMNDAIFMLGCEKNAERMWWTGYGNYAGFVGHGDYGPCMVWNDAVSNFVTPAYYMQKMLFSDNQGSKVLPFQNNSTKCFLSATLDTEMGRNDVLLKVVNKSGTPEKVNIKLTGIAQVQKNGVLSILTALPDAENSLDNPSNVFPVNVTIVAGTDFTYTFPAYSISVLRMKQ